ncbi:MAG: AEC family transporter [Desulfobacterales bacterium]|nr:AEC family transporter [Desulfobacterales bacterium]
MVLQSLFPVFALIALGVLLKHFSLTNDAFLKTSDKLIYFIFFPMMLFWKIGGAAATSAIDWKFCAAAICAVLGVYILSTAFINFKVTPFQAGSFSQSCYRFNTYIGMAIVMNALGEEGVRRFGVLIGFLIPIINLMAVSTLIWFSAGQFTKRQRVRFTLKALVSNPLILACFAGIAFSQAGLSFPVFLNNTFNLTSMVTLPLALLSIGGVLNLKSLQGNFKLSLTAALFKLLVLPGVGYFFMKLFGVTDLSFRVGMVYFALPTSTALYVLSAQLHSDTELASAAIVLSTILSFVSLTVALLI